MFDVNEAIRKEALRRGYSRQTIKTYQVAVGNFFSWCNKDPMKVSKKDVREYLYLLKEKDRAGNTLNVYLNALKFLFEEVMKRKMYVNIKYSKIPRKLPEVLSKEEIKRLFSMIKNKQHNLIVRFMYSSGLRVSELTQLRVKDLDFERKMGLVRRGKGNKDRVFVIAENLEEELKNKIRNENLKDEDFLFKSCRNDKYSTSCVRKIIKKAGKEAGIKKNIYCHTLRHSFATHLIENGYSVSEVQFLLGHNSPKTSMMYIHMASPTMIKIKSPLDEL